MRTLLPLALALGATAPADAKLIFNMTQVGSDVVLSGSGSATLAGLTFVQSNSVNPLVMAVVGMALVGTSGTAATYTGLTGPANFGSGADINGSGTGSRFGVYGTAQWLYLPSGYTSGTALTGTTTFANQTFATLGVDTGTYTWTWSSDSAELNVGAQVPEPASLALVAAGLAALGRTRRRRA